MLDILRHQLYNISSVYKIGIFREFFDPTWNLYVLKKEDQQGLPWLSCTHPTPRIFQQFRNTPPLRGGLGPWSPWRSEKRLSWTVAKKADESRGKGEYTVEIQQWMKFGIF